MTIYGLLFYNMLKYSDEMHLGHKALQRGDNVCLGYLCFSFGYVLWFSGLTTLKRCLESCCSLAVISQSKLRKGLNLVLALGLRMILWLKERWKVGLPETKTFNIHFCVTVCLCNHCRLYLGLLYFLICFNFPVIMT